MSLHLRCELIPYMYSYQYVQSMKQLYLVSYHGDWQQVVKAPRRVFVILKLEMQGQDLKSPVRFTEKYRTVLNSIDFSSNCIIDMEPDLTHITPT